jgi:hypothetical protein
MASTLASTDRTAAPGDDAGAASTAARELPARLATTRHPLLYEVNTRVWLAELARANDRPLDLGTVPESVIESIAARGFDLVWLMGVWTGGELGRRIAREHAGLREAYAAALPDWSADDVTGSPYSISSYVVDPALGGAPALARLRERLADHGIGIVLDFVPNHMAIDTPMAQRHPECFMPGDRDELVAHPGCFVELDTSQGPRVIAHGRDPYFPPWTDTLQVHARHPALRLAHRQILLDVAAQCDGLRCDMAMLMLDDIVDRTWGERAAVDGARPAEYWSELIGAVRQAHPHLLFMAEVYWQLESRLLDLGFNYAYDKVLYDRLRQGDAAGTDLHLNAHPAYQQRMVRFLENHDEERAAAVFAGERWRAAATATYTLPGLKLFHEGQLEGFRRQLPVQLGRRLAEPPTPAVESFYAALLAAVRDPIFRLGTWHRLRAEAAWDGNATHRQVIAHLWDAGHLGQRLVVVNLGEQPAQCRVRFLPSGLGGVRFGFRDLIGPERYVRERHEVSGEGMFFDLAPCQAHVFAIEPAG